MAKSCLFWVALLIHTIYTCYGDNVFDNVLEDVSSCSNSCQESQGAPLKGEITALVACERGCRLYTIIEFASDNEDSSTTERQCEESCEEAYRNTSYVKSCSFGCKHQQPMSVQKEDAELPQTIHVLYPIFAMHSMCNSMMDRLNTRLSASWTVYIQADGGNVMVVEAMPEVSLDFADPPMEEPENEEYKTSNYLETNIRSLDDSATPDLRLYAVNPSAQKLSDQQGSSNWLACVSKKTGLPRLLLSLIIFLSAMMMIWLCLSSVATAPEHRIKAQKLSLYGDLEVIQSMKEKGIQHIHPQDGAVSFSPLPVKLAVEKL